MKTLVFMLTIVGFSSLGSSALADTYNCNEYGAWHTVKDSRRDSNDNVYWETYQIGDGPSLQIFQREAHPGGRGYHFSYVTSEGHLIECCVLNAGWPNCG